MDKEVIKKMMEGKDFKGQAEKLKEVLNKIPQMQDLQKMLESLKPVKQRNTTVEGTDCLISISVDNKVSITFPNDILANKYYEEFKCQSTLIKELKQDKEFQISVRLSKEKEISKLESELKKIKGTKWYKFTQLFKRK